MWVRARSRGWIYIAKLSPPADQQYHQQQQQQQKIGEEEEEELGTTRLPPPPRAADSLLLGLRHRILRIMPLFGRRDPAKKPKKDDKSPSIEDKYVLKEQLGT